MWKMNEDEKMYRFYNSTEKLSERGPGEKAREFV